MASKVFGCLRCFYPHVRHFGKDARQRQRFQCCRCKRIFTRRTGTMRSGSRLTEAQWKLALQLFCMCAGISGADLARVLGVNRKTVQRINRVLRVLTQYVQPLYVPGVSEWDETCIGGQWVIGGVSRQTKQCLMLPIEDRTEKTLTSCIRVATQPEDIVFTDEWAGYKGLPRHMTVCHDREFVNRQARFVHTNTQEGIWGHCKPLAWHIYRGFPKRELYSYLGEVMFRYNHRSYKTRISVLSALLLV